MRGQEELVFAEEHPVFMTDGSIRDNAGRVIDVDTPVAAEVLQSGGRWAERPRDFRQVQGHPVRPSGRPAADTRFAIRGSAVTGDGFDKSKERYERGYFDAVARIRTSPRWPSLFERPGLGIACARAGHEPRLVRKTFRNSVDELFEDLRISRASKSLMIYGSEA